MAAENCKRLQIRKFYGCASQVKKVQMLTKSLIRKSNDLRDLCSIIMYLGENGSKHVKWVCLYEYTDQWKNFKSTECSCWFYLHIKSA
jgi:hypothetical protein